MKTRREFLRNSAAASATFAGNSSLVLSPLLQNLVRGAQTPPPGGQYLGMLPFLGERGNKRPFGEKYGTGLSGRLVVDLTKLNAENLVTPNDQFFIRTSIPDRLDLKDPWKIRVRGLVDEDVDLRLDDLESDVAPMGLHLMECSGNTKSSSYGLMSVAKWEGVPVDKVLDKIRIRRQATHVMVKGFDEHSKKPSRSQYGASWIFERHALSSAGAFFATRMNGEPLPEDHGFPIRLVVPGWYGCVSAKWVTDIRLVDDTSLATSQMREFASRTHQDGRPKMAVDYKPAIIEQTAMPVRVEKWRVAGVVVYRVVGILWGGSTLTTRLMIRFNNNEAYVPVENYDHRTNATWSIWTHTWQPRRPGKYQIRLSVDDRFVATSRLDRGFYARTIEVKDAG